MHVEQAEHLIHRIIREVCRRHRVTVEFQLQEDGRWNVSYDLRSPWARQLERLQVWCPIIGMAAMAYSAGVWLATGYPNHPSTAFSLGVLCGCVLIMLLPIPRSANWASLQLEMAEALLAALPQLQRTDIGWFVPLNERNHVVS